MSETGDRVNASDTFQYEAQTASGHTLLGELEANDPQVAQSTLEDAGLRVTRLERGSRGRRAAALSGADFQVFNQQLAQLTHAGLPIETGLRLIARDMRHKRLAEPIHRVADELERGVSLGEAFDKHRSLFPPLYGQLVEAGVKAGNLTGILLNLGRHLDLVQRLRATLWQAFAYPALLLIGAGIVLALIGQFIVPRFRDTFASLGISLPALTEAVMAVATWMPLIALVCFVVAVGVPLCWIIARGLGFAPWVTDHLVMPIPVVGGIVRRNLTARWCDALRLGVSAGLDLPRAIELAGEATASPRLRGDGTRLIQTLEAGRSVSDTGGLSLLPGTVPAMLETGSHHHGLEPILSNLSEMYEQQAELRLSILQTAFTPIALVLLGGVLAFVITGLFLPLITLLNNLGA